MLSRSHLVFIACLAILSIGPGLLTGCATQSDTKATAGTAAPASTAGADSSGDSIVVPTETLKGGASPASETENPEGTAAELSMADIVYRIGPGDLLSFRSFDDEKLSTDVAVRYDGCISLPVIPDVMVKDLTREEAEETIKKAYSEFYVEPQVTLTIVDAKSKTFTVMGEVAQPSEYPYTRPISLLDAISTAGGMRVNQRGGDSYVGATGQLVKALIIRREGQERKVMDFDLRGFDKSGPHPSETPVLPSDIVVVPESANLVYLLGEVGRPSVFALSPGLTLTRLLAYAGGFNESTARLKQVVLIREINNEETKVMTVDVRANLKGGKDVLLEPGDIIYVPRKWLVNVAEFVNQLIAPAQSIMGFQQQIMGLYMQAYQAYYTDEQFDLLYENSRGLDTTSYIQSLLTNLANQSKLKTVPNIMK